MLIIELPDGPDPIQSGAIAQLASQGEAGVRRVGDQPVLTEQRNDLGDAPRLRIVRVHVEVPGHGVTLPTGQSPTRSIPAAGRPALRQAQGSDSTSSPSARDFKFASS